MTVTAALPVVKVRSKSLQIVSKHAALIGGGGLLIALLIFVFLVPTPDAPNSPKFLQLLSPRGAHYFGTDDLGRDMLSRTMAGGRTDIPLAFGGMLVSLIIGVPLGLLASGQNRASLITVQITNLMQAFPLLILAVLLVSLAGNSEGNVVLAVALVGAPQVIRLVRTEGLTIRTKRFVEASEAIGASRWRTLFTHVLPNLLPSLLAQASIVVGQAIIVISSMSFLGIGIKPPTASWGGMVREGLIPIQAGQWWICLFPSIMIMLTIVAFNLIADGVRNWAGA